MVQLEQRVNPRLCMFCGVELENRGEAYYDHLKLSAFCGAAWEDWRDRLDEDRKSGG